MNGYEPRFDLDFKYGHNAEVLVAEILRRGKADSSNVEVKHKSYVDDYYYVEHEQNPRRCGTWKPSGIKVTTAQWWCYVVGNNNDWIVFWPTDLIKRAWEHPAAKPSQVTRGDNPTKGKLISGALIRQLASEAARGRTEAA